MEQLLYKIAIISDPQINLRQTNYNGVQKDLEILQRCYKNINVDALAVCGDITENGLPEEWDYFFNGLKQYCLTKNLFLVPGNMDKTNTEKGKKIFTEAYRRFSGNDHGLYFVYETDCCFFAGIAYEPINKGTITDTQLYVLDKFLQKAAVLNFPAIVFSHYQVSDTINVNWKYASMNEDSPKVRNILEKHCGKVVFFSGHTHRGLMIEPGGSIVTQKNVTYVSTPSLCYPDVEHYQADNDCEGTGFICEVYKEGIRIRGYNFLNREYLNSFDWKI